VIEEIKRRYWEGYRVFDFEDDNLVVDVNAMKALCRRLIDTFPPGEVQCLAMNGIMFPGPDRSLLELMKRAGFTHLNLSLVSIDPGVRERTGRPRNLDGYAAVVEEAVRLGFKIVSYQILGLPQETLETMIQTLVFNARLPVLLGASPFYLTPGSRVSDNFPEPEEGDFVKARLTAMAVETAHFGREDLYTLFVTSRIINFLKGIPCEKREMTLAEALCAARSQGKRAALGAELLGKILREKQLCAATKNDFRPLSRFRSDLFLRIWSSLEHIGTQERKMIRL